MAAKKNLGVARDSYMEINKDKFREAFSKRQLSLDVVSVALNYSAGYFSNVSCASGSGQLQKQASLLLKYEYGIEPDEYSLEKNPYTEGSQKGPARAKHTETIDYDRIQQMIDGAVDKAVGELKLDYTALHKVMYAAVYEAFKKVYNEPIGDKSKIAIVDNRKKGA